MIDLGGVRLRNRILTSASLLGYGAAKSRLILYGLSPIAQWVPLERFGAVTTRTLTYEPRVGHFSLREDWRLTEFPAMLRLYAGALRRVDAGWINAFGWCNIGIEAYFREYFPRTAHLNRIVSLGGFSAEEFCRLVDYVNERAKPGEIAAVELNVSCHNVNFPFETILEDVLAQAVRRPARGRGAARRRDSSSDHRERRHPRLRRLPRVLLGGRGRRESRQRGVARTALGLRAGAAQGPRDPPAHPPRGALSAGDAVQPSRLRGVPRADRLIAFRG